MGIVLGLKNMNHRAAQRRFGVRRKFGSAQDTRERQDGDGGGEAGQMESSRSRMPESMSGIYRVHGCPPEDLVVNRPIQIRSGKKRRMLHKKCTLTPPPTWG
jgi:hypothetical protein